MCSVFSQRFLSSILPKSRTLGRLGCVNSPSFRNYCTAIRSNSERMCSVFSQRFLSSILPKSRTLGRLGSVNSPSFRNYCTASQTKENSDGEITCTLIPGDGVGPELCNVVYEVFKAAGVPCKFETYFLSELQYALSVPLKDVTQSITRNGVCLKGILTTPDYSRDSELKTMNMKLRDALNLYANVVHIRSIAGIPTRHKDLDFVVIREQTEGEYSALEHESVKGVVESLKITTREKCMRIAKFAFDYATKYGRRKVTAVHKANIMKLGDGLFLKCCEEVSELYPDVELDNMIIDNCTMQLVSNPHQFDVMVLPNLYGNIIDNLAAGLIGGAGVVAGSSYSSDCVVFEPGARHTFQQGVGKNVANPTAMLLCAARMLSHVNLHYHGYMIRDAVENVISSGKANTKDIGGQHTTFEFMNAVIHSLEHKKM